MARATPRKVSVSRNIGYQHLDELVFDEKTLVKGLIVKLKEVPFMVKLFRIDAPNGSTEWVITNDMDHFVNLFVAEIKSDNRWQIEEFHRGFNRSGNPQADGI